MAAKLKPAALKPAAEKITVQKPSALKAEIDSIKRNIAEVEKSMEKLDSRDDWVLHLSGITRQKQRADLLKEKLAEKQLILKAIQSGKVI